MDHSQVVEEGELRRHVLQQQLAPRRGRSCNRWPCSKQGQEDGAGAAGTTKKAGREERGQDGESVDHSIITIPEECDVSSGVAANESDKRLLEGRPEDREEEESRSTGDPVRPSLERTDSVVAMEVSNSKSLNTFADTGGGTTNPTAMTSGSQASGGAALAASEEEKFTDQTGVKTDQNGEEKGPKVIRFYGVLSSEERAYFKSFDQVSRSRMDEKSRQHFEKKEKEGIPLLPVERSYFDDYKKSDYQEDRLVGNEVWKMRPSHKELVDYLKKKEELDKECPDWDRNPFYTRVEVEKRLARDQLAKERVRRRAAELERLTCLELLEGNFSQEEVAQKWESVDKELLDLSEATLEPPKTDEKKLPEELQTTPEEEERRAELGHLLDQIDEKLDYVENLKELGKFQQWQDRLKEQQALMPRAEWGKLKTVEYHMKEAVRSAKELQSRQSGGATGEEASEETPEELDSDDAYDTRVLKVPDLTVSEQEVAESRARLQYHIRLYNRASDGIKKIFRSGCEK